MSVDTMGARRLAIVAAFMCTHLASQAQSACPPVPLAQPSASYRLVLDPAAPATGTALRIARTDNYDPVRGYGFADIRGGNAMALAFKVAPGDYRVRVELAAGRQHGRTTIWAEDRRLMAAPVSLRPNERRTVEFTVNVRNAALAKSEHDSSACPVVRLREDEISPANLTWDDKLTLSFSGTEGAVRSVDIAPVAARRILLAGDSTVTDQGGGDYASWGQMLPRFLGSSLAVANHARSGETMKSFVASLRWDKLLADARPGDILVIQFGHNDQKQQWPRTYLQADLGYAAWLKALVADAQQRGLKVVLASSVSRRSFNAEGRITNTLAGYGEAVARVAAELKLPFIDLTARTRALYEALGPQRSVLAFAAKGADKTHHNAYGAYVIANLVAQTLLDPAHGLDLPAAPDFVPIDPAAAPAPERYEITPADWPGMRDIVGPVSGS